MRCIGVCTWVHSFAHMCEQVLSRKHPSSLHSLLFGFPRHQEHAAARSAWGRGVKSASLHSYSATACLLMPWSLRCLQSPKRCLEQSSSEMVVRA